MLHATAPIKFYSPDRTTAPLIRVDGQLVTRPRVWRGRGTRGRGATADQLRLSCSNLGGYPPPALAWRRDHSLLGTRGPEEVRGLFMISVHCKPRLTGISRLKVFSKKINKADPCSNKMEETLWSSYGVDAPQ